MEKEKEIKCRDCGTVFKVDAKEQKWFEEKGFELPSRCKACRAKRRAAKKHALDR